MVPAQENSLRLTLAIMRDLPVTSCVMTRDELLTAKQNYTGVTGYEVGDTDGYPGVVRQIGYHESGNDRLVAIDGIAGIRWFDKIQIKAV
jgi:hypothetical protein